MSNVRKLVARLNASTSQFGVGRGGVPTLTPQDIAGALGMVDDDLAREVFCAIWWPDGARLTSDVLDARLRKLVLDEYCRRNLAAQVAKLDQHIVEGEYALRNRHTNDDRSVIAAARAKKIKADAARWPWNIDVYARIPVACLAEIGRKSACPQCGGRGFIVQSETARTNCQKCNGIGQAPASKVARASALGINDATYRLVWAPTFEWAFREIADMESRAHDRIAEAIGDATDEAA